MISESIRPPQCVVYRSGNADTGTLTPETCERLQSMSHKQNIIWIHGWGCNSKVWTSLIQHFTDCNNFFPSFQNVHKQEEFLSQIQKLLLEKDYILIGWSMGGMLALETALQNQQNINRIIAFNSTVRFTSDKHKHGWHKKVLLRMKKNLIVNPEATLLQFIESIYSNDKTSSAELFIKQIFDSNILENCDFCNAGLLAGLDYLINKNLSQEITKLQTPVLWIHGQLDTICPLEGFNIFRKQMTNSKTHQFKIMPSEGHLSFFNKPEKAAKLIREFIKCQLT